MGPHDPEPLRNRRYLLLLALFGVFVLLGVAGWLASGEDKVRRGMTRAEVVARLGPPDGRMLAVEGTPINEVVFVWKGQGFTIEFDGDDRVREVTRPPSWLDKIRNNLGF